MGAKQEFAVRLYRWAVLDSHEEMDAGFPLVRRLGNEHAGTYLSVMVRLDVERRRRLLTSFIKRFHPEAVELLDDGMTREEEELLEWAVDQRREMNCAVPAPTLRISSRRLRTLLKDKLVARFGGQTQVAKMGPKIFSLESVLGPWVVRTWFDYGRRPEYFHHIDGADTSLAGFLSIESWMGISSTTDWTLGSAGSEEDIAKTMIDAVQRFLDRAPGLLKGLSP